MLLKLVTAALLLVQVHSTFVSLPSPSLDISFASGSPVDESSSAHTITINDGPTGMSVTSSVDPVRQVKVWSHTSAATSDGYMITGAGLTTSYTKAIWINPNSCTINYCGVFGGGGGAGSHGMTIDTTNSTGYGSPVLSVLHVDSNNHYQLVYDSTHLIEYGKWTHYVVTFDATSSPRSMKLYRNGVLVGSSSALYNDWTSGSASVLGGGGLWKYDGLIDRPQIYDQALTASQVAGLYLDQQQPTIENLQTIWTNAGCN